MDFKASDTLVFVVDIAVTTDGKPDLTSLESPNNCLLKSVIRLDSD